MITTLLLDVDDTLLDFTLGERVALRLAFEEAHIPFDPIYASLYHEINASWWSRFDRGEVALSQVVVERFVDLFRRIAKPMPLNFAMLYEHHLCDQHAFVRGAKGFLQRMRRDYRLYGVSNGRLSVQKKRFAESGLKEMLDGVFISEEMGVHKPEKAFFDRIAATIAGYDPAEIVLVGDSLTSDVAGGVSNGMHTVWYNRDHRELTGKYTPDFVSDDFHAIEAFIRGIG